MALEVDVLDGWYLIFPPCSPLEAHLLTIQPVLVE